MPDQPKELRQIVSSLSVRESSPVRAGPRPSPASKVEFGTAPAASIPLRAAAIWGWSAARRGCVSASRATSDLGRRGTGGSVRSAGRQSPGRDTSRPPSEPFGRSSRRSAALRLSSRGSSRRQRRTRRKGRGLADSCSRPLVRDVARAVIEQSNHERRLEGIVNELAFRPRTDDPEIP